MINYSIIIPHKDIPELLQRCLDSIPVRDDVQVIVVDDNSNPDKVDFGHFPVLERSDVEVFFTKEGRGAGYARNVGLQHAMGKWVLFADADDFFTEEYGALLDETVDASADVVFYDYKNVLSEDVSEEVEKRLWYRAYFSAYLNGEAGAEEKLRTQVVVPWCKIIRRDLIEKHGIRFEEVKWGNDVLFSTKVAINAQKIDVNGRVVYVLTERSGSLAHEIVGTAEELRVRLVGDIESDALFRLNGYHKKGLAERHLNRAYAKHGLPWLMWFGVTNICNREVFCATMSFLKPIIKRKMRTARLMVWQPFR